MPKGTPNKKYTGEFKQLVVETMQKNKLSYRETATGVVLDDGTQINAKAIICNASPYNAYTKEKVL